MALVSLAKFGALHGVSKQAASKWKARGLLVLADGKVDVEASNARLKRLRKGGVTALESVDERDPFRLTVDEKDNLTVDARDTCRLTVDDALTVRPGESTEQAAVRILSAAG